MVNVQELRHMPISEIIKILGIFEDEDLVTSDLTKLAYTLNVSVLVRNFDGTRIAGERIICAFVTNSKGNSAIFYSDDLLNNEARIIIAKAFAKYIMTGNNNFFVTQSTNFSKRENTLAYELLMPEQQVRKIMGKLLMPTTFSLAKIFDVSQEFVRERLNEMQIDEYVGGYNF